MKKRDIIIYWVATIWFASAMVASGIQQIFSLSGFAEIMQQLQYPAYFSVIVGAWKMVGVAIVLAPKLPLLKEWAYSGFFLLLTGAFFSHLAVGDEAGAWMLPLFLLALAIVSWYFRPASRKIATANS